MSADQIWAVRLHFAQFVDVVRRHFVDARVRSFAAIQPSCLQTIERLIWTKCARQVSVLDDIAAGRMNSEEWRARPATLNQHQ